ncbi:MAG: hypothetical protein FWH11_12130 [Micrococcales bacterium]|nr:hypothetical protein [Micrococcales bacterium]
MAYLLVGALLVLTLGGCGADEPSGTTTGTTPDVRERLAAGLAAVGADAELVEMKSTSLTPVGAAWLSGWQVIDVEAHWENDPVRFYAALSDDGTAVVLSGSPDAFAEMARNAQVVIDDTATAVEVGSLYLDVTRDFYRYSYRIDTMSDIKWPKLTSTETQRVAELDAQYGEIVQPPTAEPSDTGWSVLAWMIHDRTLVRHDLNITADGYVQDSQEVVATNLPLPQSP